MNSAFDEAKNSKFIAFVLGLHGAALLGEGVGFLDAVVGGCVAVAAWWEPEGLDAEGQVVLVGVEDEEPVVRVLLDALGFVARWKKVMVLS